SAAAAPGDDGQTSASPTTNAAAVNVEGARATGVGRGRPKKAESEHREAERKAAEVAKRVLNPPERVQPERAAKKQHGQQ
ncbi:hypothetical protein BpHYR1_014301, partial [Brachionus plicatilis]